MQAYREASRRRPKRVSLRVERASRRYRRPSWSQIGWSPTSNGFQVNFTSLMSMLIINISEMG
jgi:hypothetical protein